MAPDSNRMRIPEVVTEQNELKHVERLRRRQKRHESLKARDRRQNFQLGELAGGLYFLGLLAICVAASGQMNHYPLNWWERLLVALVGAAALIGKTYTKRRFWQQTEDAEYKEDNDGTCGQERTTCRRNQRGR